MSDSKKFANTAHSKDYMPGSGDVDAMMEYIAGKNSSPEQRKLLHEGGGLVEENYDPGYQKGEKGSKEVG